MFDSPYICFLSPQCCPNYNKISTLITMVNDIRDTLSTYNILGDYVDMCFLFELSVELISHLMIEDPPFFFLFIFQLSKADISRCKSWVFVNL